MLMWHGTHSWTGLGEIPASRSRKADHGPGLYLTDRLATAKRYARGGGRIMLFSIAQPLKLSWDTLVSRSDVMAFLSDMPSRLNGRRAIISDVDDLCASTGSMRAEMLINLFVAHRACSGPSSQALNAFLRRSGAEATSIAKSDDELWLAIHDIDVIQAFSTHKAGQIPTWLDRLSQPSEAILAYEKRLLEDSQHPQTKRFSP